MKNLGRFVWLATGLTLGVLAAVLYGAALRPAQAANDRYEDYILCTGPVSGRPNAPTDGVWLLDYRAGRLLGTVIDRTNGRIVSWAEVDLVQEFGVPPKKNVHFLMTTGSIAQGQAALYVAETTTGKFGVYSLGPRNDGQSGLMIRRHDLSLFRRPPAP